MVNPFFKDARILITGAAGLIGSNLVVRLLETRANVRAVVHHAQPLIIDPRIEYLTLDLTTADACREAVRGVHYVFHCAANTPGAAMTVSEPLKFVTSNILIDTHLLQAAYEAGVKKFLWLSSATTAYPPAEHAVGEGEMFDGGPYEKYFFVGWSKRFTEVLCRMYGEKLEKPMTTIVLRLTYVYGPNDNFDPKSSHVIPALIRKVVERQDPVEVWGTGQEIRDTLYVDDAVAAMLTAMARVDRYDVFNIGLGQGYSVRQILDMILELDGYVNARVVFDPTRPTTIPVRLVDTTKAERRLGFKAKTDLSPGLAQTLAWYRRERARAPSLL